MRGTNTYTGATTVSSGTLALSGIHHQPHHRHHRHLRAARLADRQRQPRHQHRRKIRRPHQRHHPWHSIRPTHRRRQRHPRRRARPHPRRRAQRWKHVHHRQQNQPRRDLRHLQRTSAKCTFPTGPNYIWQISYTGGDGNDVVLTLSSLMTPIEAFRFQYFGTISNTGNAADSADPDGDGRTNLDEFNASTNPLEVTAPDVVITNPAAEPVTVAALADTLHLTSAIQQSTATAPLSWVLVQSFRPRQRHLRHLLPAPTPPSPSTRPAPTSSKPPPRSAPPPHPPTAPLLSQLLRT